MRTGTSITSTTSVTFRRPSLRLTRQRVTPWRDLPRRGGGGRRGGWTSNTFDRPATATRWNFRFPRPAAWQISCTGLASFAWPAPAIWWRRPWWRLCRLMQPAASRWNCHRRCRLSSLTPSLRSPLLPPPPPGVFSMRHRVTWGDLDMARQLGDATLLSYVETCGFGVIAAHHWPAARMAAQGFAIILRRHQIENLASAALDDEWRSRRGFPTSNAPLPRGTTPSGGWPRELC